MIAEILFVAALVGISIYYFTHRNVEPEKWVWVGKGQEPSIE